MPSIPNRLPPGYYTAGKPEVVVDEDGVMHYTFTVYPTGRPSMKLSMVIPSPPPEPWEHARNLCIQHLTAKYGQEDTDSLLEFLDDPSIYKESTFDLREAMEEAGSWPAELSRTSPYAPINEWDLWPVFISQEIEPGTDTPVIYDELLDFHDLVWRAAAERGLA